MSNFVKNFVVAVFALVLVALLFSFFFTPVEEPTQLTLGEVAQKINSQQVEKIVVNGNNLEIGLKDGTQAEAKKEFEVGITETLRNYGVDQMALQQVSLEIQEESGSRFWL